MKWLEWWFTLGCTFAHAHRYSYFCYCAGWAQTFSILRAAHTETHFARWPGASGRNPCFFRKVCWHHTKDMTSCFDGDIHSRDLQEVWFWGNLPTRFIIPRASAEKPGLGQNLNKINKKKGSVKTNSRPGRRGKELCGPLPAVFSSDLTIRGRAHFLGNSLWIQSIALYCTRLVPLFWCFNYHVEYRLLTKWLIC